MKISPFPILLAFVLNASSLQAQDRPPSADQVIAEATSLATRENKSVLIIFHASWCGWCHKMDSSINDKSCKSFFDKNYVIRHLVVDESTDKKNLENPGANELRKKYHGDEEGIPFWFVLDKNGKLVADSQIRPEGSSIDTKGENVGCPAAEKEVTYFIDILKKTSHLSQEDETAIRKRFRQNEN